jgi:S1-C subfamily serine protease
MSLCQYAALTRLAARIALGITVSIGYLQWAQNAIAKNSECILLLKKKVRATEALDYRAIVKATRTLLSLCSRELMADDSYGSYGSHLADLAWGLVRTGETAEAALVADRCLQLKSDDHLSCMIVKGAALFEMKRFTDAKQMLQRSLKEPALTELDEANKKLARTILAKIPQSAQAPNAPHNQSAGNRQYGTGFVVRAEGLIITNFHVTRDCRQVETLDGKQLSSIASSPELDISLLQARGELQKKVAIFRNSEPALGEPVTAFGFPLTGLLSKAGNVTTGIVSADTGFRDNSSQFQITAPVQPGNSGGPLLDQYGNVIGVVVSKLDAAKVSDLTGDIPQNVNFGIKGAEAIKFMQRNGVSPVIEPAKEPLKTEEIASRAKSIALQLVCLR